MKEIMFEVIDVNNNVSQKSKDSSKGTVIFLDGIAHLQVRSSTKVYPIVNCKFKGNGRIVVFSKKENDNYTKPHKTFMDVETFERKDEVSKAGIYKFWSRYYEGMKVQSYTLLKDKTVKINKAR